MYGYGNRVHNQLGTKAKENYYRCTVCGAVQEVAKRMVVVEEKKE
jgi:hypothetical protein